MSLIQQLNDLVGLSPDEIVARIAPIGWVKVGFMTPEQFERMSKKPACVGIFSINFDGFRVQHGSIGDAPSSWEMWFERRDCGNPRSYYAAYWVCLEEDVNRVPLPSCDLACPC